MEGKMTGEQHALVHALLDDAKMLLAGAKHNHEKPQGAYDHGRSVAKATSASAYAEAADMLHQKYMGTSKNAIFVHRRFRIGLTIC